MSKLISIEIEGEQVLKVAIGKMSDGISDFRPFWQPVIDQFYKFENQLFDSEGATGKSGKYKPLSPAYKEIKLARWGDVPILTASGKLRKSLTSQTGDSIVEKTADSLTVGSKLPYPQKSQGRNPIDLTEEQTHEMLRSLTRQLAKMAKDTGLGE